MDNFSYLKTDDDKHPDPQIASTRKDWEAWRKGSDRKYINRPNDGWINMQAQHALYLKRMDDYQKTIKDRTDKDK